MLSGHSPSSGDTDEMDAHYARHGAVSDTTTSEMTNRTAAAAAKTTSTAAAKEMSAQLNDQDHSQAPTTTRHRLEEPLAKCAAELDLKQMRTNATNDHHHNNQLPSETKLNVISATLSSGSPPPSTSLDLAPADQLNAPNPLQHLQHPSASTSTAYPQQHLQQQQWFSQVAAQTHQGVRQRMSQASDQLGHSLRQLYASASSIAADVPPPYHNIPGIVPYYHGRSIGPPPSYDDVINPYAPPPTYQSLFGQMREARKTSRGLLDLLGRLLIILISTLGCTLLIAFMILIPFTMIIVGAVYIDECRIEHIPAFLLVGGLVWASKNTLHCYSQCRQMPSASSSVNGDANSDVYLPASSASSASGSLSHEEGATAAASAAAAAATATTTPMTITTTTLTTSDVLYGELESREHRAVHRHPSRRDHHHEAQQHQHQHQHQHHSMGRLKSSICDSLLSCILFGWFIAGCVIVFRNYEPDFENPASLRYCHKTVYMYTFWLISSAILLLGLFICCICCLMVSSAIASRQEDVDLA